MEEEPQVPQEVLDAIDNLSEGNTASKEDIEEALKTRDSHIPAHDECPHCGRPDRVEEYANVDGVGIFAAPGGRVCITENENGRCTVYVHSSIEGYAETLQTMLETNGFDTPELDKVLSENQEADEL